MTKRDRPPTGEAALCVVLRNDEEQYAIWPADRRIPAGWRQVGGPESAGWCADLVDRLWTDMRPASTRAEQRPPETWPGTVPELVRKRARREPSALAVLSDEGRLSYAELTGRADRLAHRLRESGVGAESVVTVCLDRVPELIVALLAVLNSGAALLPLDPATPRQRMTGLVAETGSRLIVSSREHAPMFTECEARILHAGELAAHAPRRGPRPAQGPGPHDLAYVIYTSGSTGPPKGVMIAHRSLAHSLTAVARAYGLTPGDRVLHAAALGFDTSLEQIFAPLISGATLVLAGTRTWAPTELLHRLPEHGITVADLTPAYWHRIVSVADHDESLASLRLVIVGGEIVTTKDCRAILHRIPGARLVNAYGLTETTITSTLCDLNEEVLAAPDTAVAPIGRPLEGNHVHVLDAELRPVPPGERGEIYIGGPGLARGIWRQPALTARQFLPDPHGSAPGDRMYRTGDLGRRRSDGNLEVLGRVDDQVKIRGFRVDPAEVEAALVSQPEIGQAMVVVRTRSSGDRDLVAYVTATSPPTDDEAVLRARLRSALSEVLPGHMIPAAFHAVERLPVTPGGKLDRKAVPESVTTAPTTGVDDRPVPQGMAQLWGQILDVDYVRPHDDFFELGGNSLLAMEMLARTRVVFGIGITQIRDLTRSLLRYPTLAAFAEAVRQARAGTLAQPDGGSVDFAAETDRRVPTVGRDAPAPDSCRPGDVLLTGATGFCGAYMIDELLRRTTGRILCLVRASDDQHGLERIRASHQRFVLSDLSSDRVQPVVGDLGKPGLGLSPSRFEELGSTIDAVYHFGGHVNFIYPYHELRAANVDGTYEIIRLAAGRAVPVHFTSSMAVLAGFGPAGVHEVTENTPLRFPEYLSVGYVETKWVGEALLRKASDAGLPVAVYRLMDVTGSSGTGVLNTSSEMAALIDFIAGTGLCPDVRLPLDFLPADQLARAIGHISTRHPARGEVYHLTNPRPTLLNSLAERLRRRGYPVQEIPYTEWIAALMKYAAGHPTDPITPFVPLFVDRCARADISVSEMYFQGVFTEFTRDNAQRALMDAGIDIPPVDAEMMDRYIDFLQQDGAVRPGKDQGQGAAQW
ncbi:amino acid adenylation domain-containing protein [Streptomyces neyagawaensis]|uniref:amino acid adenylation domain-containing protein n=1 Tax=Streptomyces neyagawaensis TaxID=42238 RepID=UPI00099F3DFF|nr:amino acid adenylation domain-containing protein [Streptomyces neyagawaensis]MCL6738318.1 amino acid adenylation domain-containing protein [Streptomyces neyagawaensis]MDE1688173.1 amino acid adenylation domain-containing protein [Streptomyces neyagawaensis]